MVVCSYFLKGQCRFGDQCKNEHPGPKPFSGFGGGGGFGRSGSTNSNKTVCKYFLNGECRFGNNCKFAHPSAGSGQNAFGTQSNFGSQSVFGQGRSTSGFGGGSRNTGFNRNQNQNRFGVLSNETTMGGQATVFGGGQQQSNATAILNNPSQVTQIQQIVHRDMETWDASHQWPLSCYTYLKEEPCLAGLLDYSPEEIRKEAYDAKAKNTSQAYEQGLKSLMERSKQRRMELKNINMHQLQSEIKSSMAKPSTESVGTLPSSQSGGLFGATSPTNQSQGLFGSASSTTNQSQSLFGSGPSTTNQSQSVFGSAPSATNQSQGLFGSSTGGGGGGGMFGAAQKPFGVTGSQATGTSLFGSSSTGLFGASSTGPSPSTAPFGNGNTTTTTNLFGTTTSSQPGLVQQSALGSTQVSSGQTTNNNATNTTPSTLKCSQDDLDAFKADRFVLGKIPECPPPPELCS